MVRNVSYPARQLRHDFHHFRRLNRRSLSGLIVVEFTGCIVVSVCLGVAIDGPVRWYLLGVLHPIVTAGVIAMIGFVFITSRPSAMWNIRGSIGESSTRELLVKARKQKVTWGHVDSVTTSGGDIDHLVVTRRGGILAVDSKWRSQIDADRVGDDAASALRAAKRSESILRSHQVGALKRDSKARHREDRPSFSVTPVVVVWGAEQRRMPAEVERGGVTFVAGDNFANWLRSQSGEVVEKDAARRILESLQAMRRDQLAALARPAV